MWCDPKLKAVDETMRKLWAVPAETAKVITTMSTEFINTRYSLQGTGVERDLESPAVHTSFYTGEG